MIRAFREAPTLCAVVLICGLALAAGIFTGHEDWAVAAVAPGIAAAVAVARRLGLEPPDDPAAPHSSRNR